MILAECKENFWYFLREVMRIPVPGALKPSKFLANRGNIAMLWLYFNHITSITTILRQTGKTTNLSSIVTWLLTVGTTNSLISLLTKNDSLRGETLGKVKSMIEELPEYVNLANMKKDIFNSEEIKIEFNDNRFKASLSSSSPKNAEKVGRGYTSSTILIDEAAFIDNIEIAMGALLMSGNAARTFARQMGKPYGTIIVTTAGNISDRDANYIYTLVQGAAIWRERMMDCEDRTTLEDMVYTNCASGRNTVKTPMVNITMSYRQLGYDDDWLRMKLQENASSPENIARDMFNRWEAGASKSPIPKEYLDAIIASEVVDPRIDIVAPYAFILSWFISEEEMHRRSAGGESFVIGVDTSDAVGRDDISFLIRSVTTGEVVCTGLFNEINLITLADFFVDMLVKYTNTTMIIERKSSAITIIDYMILKLSQHGINPYMRLYNNLVQHADKYSKELNEVMRCSKSDHTTYTKHKKHIGFNTSGVGLTSRSDLYSKTLMNSLKYTSSMCRDTVLIQQLSSITIVNNRVDHANGGHDDMVIAFLLSYFLMTQGVNLSYYGIETRSILKHNGTYLNEKFKVEENGFTQDEIVEMEEEFNSLLDELGRETNPIVSKQIELKIKKLASELDVKGSIASVEEMLEDVRRNKRVRLVMQGN